MSLKNPTAQQALAALLARLEASVPPPDIRPGQSLDAIMYVAGQRNIIDLVRRIVDEEE